MSNWSRTKIKALVFIGAVVFCLASLNTGHADIYRYIDDNGVMHFTNAPTSSKHKYKVFLREPARRKYRYSPNEFDHLIADASQQTGVSVPLIKAMFIDTNPVPAKTTLAMMGKIKAANPRLPLYDMKSDTIDKLKQVITDYGLI